jgi:hypothetical protein
MPPGATVAILPERSIASLYASRNAAESCSHYFLPGLWKIFTRTRYLEDSVLEAKLSYPREPLLLITGRCTFRGQEVLETCIGDFA